MYCGLLHSVTGISHGRIRNYELYFFVESVILILIGTQYSGFFCVYDEPSADSCLHENLHSANVHHRVDRRDAKYTESSRRKGYEEHKKNCIRNVPVDRNGVWGCGDRKGR